MNSLCVPKSQRPPPSSLQLLPPLLNPHPCTSSTPPLSLPSSPVHHLTSLPLQDPAVRVAGDEVPRVCEVHARHVLGPVAAAKHPLAALQGAGVQQPEVDVLASTRHQNALVQRVPLYVHHGLVGGL